MSQKVTSATYSGAIGICTVSPFVATTAGPMDATGRVADAFASGTQPGAAAKT